MQTDAPMKLASLDKPETVYVAKGLHFANQAAAMFDTAIIEGGMKGNAKAFFASLSNRCKMAVKELKGRMRPGEALTTIQNELADNYWLDTMFTLLLSLDAKERVLVEDYMASIINKNPHP